MTKSPAVIKHFHHLCTLLLTAPPNKKSLMVKLSSSQKMGQRMHSLICLDLNDLWNNCFVKINIINSIMKSLCFLAAVNESNSTFSFPFVNYGTYSFKIFLDKQLSSWQSIKEWHIASLIYSLKCLVYNRGEKPLSFYCFPLLIIILVGGWGVAVFKSW